MLTKAIEHGKEKRKEYRGSKAFDPSCRCHGGCPWCLENRMYKFKKRELAMEQRLFEEEVWNEQADKKEETEREESEAY